MATPGTVETSASCAAEANTDAKESEPKSTALSLCAVCGDKNASPGPGALGCQPCRKFFNRHSKSPMTYKCRKEENCHINIKTRRDCNFCRYRKCLEVGFGQKNHPTPKKKIRRSDEDMLNLIQQHAEATTNAMSKISDKSSDDVEPLLSVDTSNSHTIPTYVVVEEQNGSNSLKDWMPYFSPNSGYVPAPILQTEEIDCYFQSIATKSSSDMTESSTSNGANLVHNSTTELQENPILLVPKPMYAVGILGQTENFSAYAGANREEEGVGTALRNGILAANQVNSDLSESATLPNQEVNEPTENDENGCWTCSECGTKIGSICHLKEHICSEHLSNWQPYQCLFCLHRCPTVENMIGHYDEMHPYFVPKFQFVDPKKEKSIAFEKLFESSVKLGFH